MHNYKSYSYPLDQKQVLFFIYTEIFYGSALLKIYALHPLGKNTEDLKLD